MDKRELLRAILAGEVPAEKAKVKPYAGVRPLYFIEVDENGKTNPNKKYRFNVPDEGEVWVREADMAAFLDRYEWDNMIPLNFRLIKAKEPQGKERSSD